VVLAPPASSLQVTLCGSRSVQVVVDAEGGGPFQVAVSLP
jgi:hypothetical protein